MPLGQVLQVQFFTKGDFAESRYFKQLRIFVQLRSSIEQQFEKAMETITKFFKEEKDFLYRKGEVKGEVKGRQEGREEERLKFVTNLLTQSALTDVQIAGIAGTPLSFVEDLRAQLKK